MQTLRYTLFYAFTGLMVLLFAIPNTIVFFFTNNAKLYAQVVAWGLKVIFIVFGIKVKFTGEKIKTLNKVLYSWLITKVI